MKILYFLLSFALLSSCFNNNDTALGALKNYVNKIAKGNLSKDDYKDMTTGSLLKSIEQLSDQDFEKLNRTQSIDLEKVKILRESCEIDSCAITYIVEYKSKAADGSSYKTSVRKIANLSKHEKSWKISQVDNIKTYHETNDALNPLEE
ncbi:MAG: DUF4878 domain-containing protein [Bacteriovoracaceae bacterium]|jgi:hypothetical protein|nr:DUF4878 domain-containing protein [Bacteriovoracaceae bacterium]